MAYGTKYKYQYLDATGTDCEVRLQLDGYSGSVTDLVPAQTPFEITWGQQGQQDLTRPLMVSTAFLRFKGNTAGQAVQEVFDSGDTEWRVQYLEDGGLFWQGFLATDLWRDNPDVPDDTIELEAIDGLALLENRTAYTAPGSSEPWEHYTPSTALYKILRGWTPDQGESAVMHELPITTSMDWRPDELDLANPSTDCPLDHLDLYNPAYQQLDDQREVEGTLDQRTQLEGLCERFGLRLFQAGGQWWLRQRDQVDDGTSLKRWTMGTADTTFGTSTTTDVSASLPYQLRRTEKPRQRVQRLRALESVYTYDELANLIAEPSFEDGYGEWTTLYPDVSNPSSSRLDYDNTDLSINGTQEDQWVMRMEFSTSDPADLSRDILEQEIPAILHDAGPRAAYTIECDTAVESLGDRSTMKLFTANYGIRTDSIGVRQEADAADDGTLFIESLPGTNGAMIIPEGAELGVFKTGPDQITTITLTEPAFAGDTELQGNIGADVSWDDSSKDAWVEFFYWDASTNAGITWPRRPETAEQMVPQKVTVPQNALDGTPVTGDMTMRLGTAMNSTGLARVWVDNLSLEITVEGEPIEETSYIALDDHFGRNQTLQHRIGDGPTKNHPRGIFDGNGEPLFRNWGTGPNPGQTGKLLEQVLAEQWMRQQRETLDRRTFDYTERGAELGPQYVYSLDGKSYTVSYLRYSTASAGNNGTIEISELKDAGISGLERTFSMSAADTTSGGGGSTIVNSGDGSGGGGASTWDELGGKPSGLFSSNGDSDGIPETQSLVQTDITTALGYTPADETTSLTAGTGLSGGGDLSSDRTLSIKDGGVDTTQLADGAVGTTQLATGAVTVDEIKLGDGLEDDGSNALRVGFDTSGPTTKGIPFTGASENIEWRRDPANDLALEVVDTTNSTTLMQVTDGGVIRAAGDVVAFGLSGGGGSGSTSGLQANAPIVIDTGTDPDTVKLDYNTNDFTLNNGTLELASGSGGGAGSLSELSDVSTAAQADGNVLASGGTDYREESISTLVSDHASKSDVGLGNVENVALSTATWTDMGISQSDVSKSDVGLGNVPNTDIAYSSTIPADAFTTTEVTNVRGNALADGSTPWTSNNFYDDSDAISAINNDADHGSTASHNYFSGSHDDLSNVSSADHHTRPSAGDGLAESSNTFSVNESQVDHDSLNQYVANEHVDHSSVSISAGTALSGGGDLTSSRTLNVSGPLTSIPFKTSGDSLEWQADANDDLILRNTTDSQTLLKVDQDTGKVLAAGDIVAFGLSGGGGGGSSSGLQAGRSASLDTSTDPDTLNVNLVAGSNVSITTDANNDYEISATGAVASVFGRTGDVTAQSGDYSHSQISGISSDDHHTRYADSEAKSAVTASDVGLGNVENVALSTAGWTDMGISRSDVSASDVGLGNVENVALSTATWSDMGIAQSDVSKSDVGLGSVTNDEQVVDAGAVPSIQANISGNKPAAGTAGRIYLDTTNQRIERDNGSSWIEYARAPSNIGASDLGFDPATQSELNSHTSDTTNPHSVTASQVGLGNVENIALSSATWSDMGIARSDVSHSDLSGVSSDDHHTRYSDSEARGAVKAGIDYVDFANKELADYDVDGRLYWDKSAGMYIKSSNADTSARLLWSGANVSLGTHISASFDDEDQPTLNVNSDLTDATVAETVTSEWRFTERIVQGPDPNDYTWANAVINEDGGQSVIVASTQQQDKAGFLTRHASVGHGYGFSSQDLGSSSNFIFRARDTSYWYNVFETEMDTSGGPITTTFHGQKNSNATREFGKIVLDSTVEMDGYTFKQNSNNHLEITTPSGNTILLKDNGDVEAFA